MKRNDIATTIEMINPIKAKEYLDTYVHGRKLNKSQVHMYARDMISGEWKLNHQGIAFDFNGNMIDGQHRMYAIIESGMEIPMMVTRALSKDAVIGVDVLIPRNAGENLAMRDNGITSPALRCLNIQATIRTLYKINDVQDKLSVAEMERVFYANEAILVDIYQFINRGIKDRRSGLLAGIASALLAGVSEEDVNAWVQVFSYGTLYDLNDPQVPKEFNAESAIRWKYQTMERKYGKYILDRRQLYIGTQASINDFINGAEIGKRARIILKEPVWDIKAELEKSLQKRGLAL